MSDVTSFQPSWYLRNGHVQTILASSPFRAWGKNPMCDAAREIIIKTPEGVRLQGYYSCQKSKYDFSSLFSLKTIQAVTDQMLDQYSEFKSASDYFKNYSIINDAIDDLPVSTTIMTAADDPIIPVEDFQRLKLNHRTRLVIHTFGGHNGFIDGFFLKSWYEQKLADLFDTIVKEAGKLRS